MDGNGTKYVTWFHFVSVGLGIVIVPILLLWLAFGLIREDIKEMRTELKGEIEKVQEKIDKIHPPTP